MVTLFMGGVQMRVGGCSKNMSTLFELDLYEWLFSNQLSKSRKKKKSKASMGQWEELGRSPLMLSPPPQVPWLDACPRAVARTHSGTQCELGANRNEKVTDWKNKMGWQAKKEEPTFLWEKLLRRRERMWERRTQRELYTPREDFPASRSSTNNLLSPLPLSVRQWCFSGWVWPRKRPIFSKAAFSILRTF